MTSHRSERLHPAERTGESKQQWTKYQASIREKYFSKSLPRIVLPETEPCLISGSKEKWTIRVYQRSENFENEPKRVKYGQDRLRYEHELVCIGDGMNIYAYEHTGKDGKARLFLVDFFC